MKVSIAAVAFLVVVLVALEMASAASSRLSTQFLVEVRESQDPVSVAHSLGMAYGGPLAGSPHMHVFKMVDPSTGVAHKSVLSSSSTLLKQHTVATAQLKSHPDIVSFEEDKVVVAVRK